MTPSGHGAAAAPATSDRQAGEPRGFLRGRCSGFRTQAGQVAYRQAYERVLDELWPVAHDHVWLPTAFGRSHAVVSGPRGAPPLILLHGAGLSATSWYLQAEPLAAGFRIFAFDLVFDRGLGTQQATVGGARDCAAWVADLIDGLGVHTASMVGLSQGAWVAASAARFRPDLVDRLALLAPAATLRRFRLPFWLLFRGVQHLLPKGDPVARTRRTFEMVNALPDERFLEQTALGLEHFREQRPPVLPARFSDDDLRRIVCPTLVFVAGNEVLYDPTKALERARRLLPRLERSGVVADAGHFVTMARPGFVNAAVAEFLA